MIHAPMSLTYLFALQEWSTISVLPTFLSACTGGSWSGSHQDQQALEWDSNFPSRFKARLNARLLKWSVLQTQEAPSCLVPLLLLVQAPPALRAGMRPDQATLIAMFLAHYAWRAFAYPLLLRGGKPTALLPWLLAAVFCCWNGFIQVPALSQNTSPPSVLCPPLSFGPPVSLCPPSSLCPQNAAA